MSNIRHSTEANIGSKIGSNLFAHLYSKLDDHYEGPHKITNVFNDPNVEVAITQNKRKIAHKNKLKLAHLRANLETLE